MTHTGDSLLELVKNRLRMAQQHRTTQVMTDGKTVEQALELCHRAREQQFSDDYLSTKSDDDPLIYFPLTIMKSRASAAHIYDILVNVMDFPISVQPTPIPELPKSKVKELAQRMYDAWVSGGFNVDDISSEASRLKAQGRDEVLRVASDAAAAHSMLLKDQFTEADFNDILLHFLDAFCLYPTAFLRQRFTMVEQLSWGSGDKPRPKKVLQPRWEVVSAHDMFPSVDSTSTQKGTYTIVREHLDKKSFYDQRDMESYDADAIDACLMDMNAVPEPEKDAEGNPIAKSDTKAEVHQSGGVSDVAGAGTTRSALSDSITPPDQANASQSALWRDRYSVTQYTMFGLASGSELMEDASIKNLKPNAFYESEITICGERRIRTVVYPIAKEGDPLATRPIWGASYRSRGDAFWGEGAEKILRSLQRKANADFRGWAINNANTELPIGAVDYAAVSRYTTNPTVIQGGKMFLIDNDPTKPRTGQSRVVEFTDIPNHSALYMNSLTEDLRLADEVFGIPAFSHGQSQVGTIGRTFNGMALVYGAALKDLKLSMRWLTKGVLTPIGRFNYNHNLMYNDDPAIHGDTQVVIKGPEGIVQREMAQLNGTQMLQTLIPLAEAGLLPPDLVKAVAIQQARDAGAPVDQFVSNKLGGPSKVGPGAGPGIPMPTPAASNPAFNQQIGGTP